MNLSLDIRNNYSKIQFKPSQFPQFLIELGLYLEKTNVDTQNGNKKGFSRGMYVFRKK
jgi:hypothetical protein